MVPIIWQLLQSLDMQCKAKHSPEEFLQMHCYVNVTCFYGPCLLFIFCEKQLLQSSAFQWELTSVWLLFTTGVCRPLGTSYCVTSFSWWVDDERNYLKRPSVNRASTNKFIHLWSCKCLFKDYHDALSLQCWICWQGIVFILIILLSHLQACFATRSAA